jgi:hypothetical protein
MNYTELNNFWESKNFKIWLELAKREYLGNNPHRSLYYDFFSN